MTHFRFDCQLPDFFGELIDAPPKIFFFSGGL